MKSKNEFWNGGILGFFKLLLFVTIYSAIFGFGIFYITDIDLASEFVASYFVLTIIGFVYYNNRSKLTKENLKKTLLKFKLFSKKALKFIFYFSLFILVMLVLFGLLGWILSFGAVAIIIILLILILLK